MAMNQPWYEKWKEEIDLATRRMRASIRAGLPGANDESQAFFLTSAMNLVYESNCMENAGLSRSDTRKVLLESDFALKSPEADVFHRQAATKFKEVIEAAGSGEGIHFFAGKKRSYREVYLHYAAISVSLERIIRLLKACLGDQGKHPTQDRSCIVRNSLEDQPFNEYLLRELHFIMGNGLMPRDAGVEAGFYRKDIRTTGSGVAFTAPENIGMAMQSFVARANELLLSNENPIMKAAKISYDFLMIHPFPDFNGRMSRLIMNMVLQYDGPPFFVALRSNAKEKHRYLTALRHADRGKITSYACLIARAVNEGFEQLNRNLERAGLPMIEPAGDQAPG
jgi:Fic family protein